MNPFATLATKEFLKQPLELGMFVPCVDGVPIEEPLNTPDLVGGYAAEEVNKTMRKKRSQFQKAKEEVIFEGFEIRDTRGGNTHVRNKDWEIEFDEYGTRLHCYCGNLDTERVINVEHLVMKHDNNRLNLTPNAIKQIGL